MKELIIKCKCGHINKFKVKSIEDMDNVEIDRVIIETDYFLVCEKCGEILID